MPEPRIMLGIHTLRSSKLIELPSDAARWGWIVMLGEATLQRPPWRFSSRAALLAGLVWHFRRHVDEWIAAGLLQVCPDGALVVPNWRRYAESDGRTSVPAEVRRLITERFAGRCAYCGTTTGSMVMEHRMPVARGGTNDPDNLVLACATCNTRKGAALPEAWPVLFGPSVA